MLEDQIDSLQNQFEKSQQEHQSETAAAELINHQLELVIITLKSENAELVFQPPGRQIQEEAALVRELETTAHKTIIGLMTRAKTRVYINSYARKGIPVRTIGTPGLGDVKHVRYAPSVGVGRIRSRVFAAKQQPRKHC